MPRRILKGTAVSSNAKTVVVRVDRATTHPLYGKTIRHSKKYHAHDEANSVAVGDVVRIIESRPHSKLKRWEVLPAGSASAEANS